MRTCAVMAVLAAAFAAGCGDSSSSVTSPAPDACADGGVDGQICGSGKVCRSKMCAPSTCGDGVVVPGEQCDGGPGCKADCTFLCTDNPATQCAGTAAACGAFACMPDHTCGLVADQAQNLHACDAANPANVCIQGGCKPAPVCGNGKVEFGEDCDDGNLFSNDGCERCSFEQVARVAQLVQQFDTDAFCTKNALGTAISPVPESLVFIQRTWKFPVKDGSISVVFKSLGGSIRPGPGRRSIWGLSTPRRSGSSTQKTARPPTGMTARTTSTGGTPSASRTWTTRSTPPMSRSTPTERRAPSFLRKSSIVIWWQDRARSKR